MSRFSPWILLPLLCTTNIAAQIPWTLLEGQRVRVALRCDVAPDPKIECREHRSPQMVTGYLQALAGDTLLIRAKSSDPSLAIPAASVAQLWVVDGKKGNFWKGAGIGLLAGALIGGVIGSTQEFCLLDCGPATAIGVVVGAPAGLLLGGVLGAVVQSDRWRALLGNDRGVSVAPRLDVIGLTVSVAF